MLLTDAIVKRTVQQRKPYKMPDEQRIFSPKAGEPPRTWPAYKFRYEARVFDGSNAREYDVQYD